MQTEIDYNLLIKKLNYFFCHSYDIKKDIDLLYDDDNCFCYRLGLYISETYAERKDLNYGDLTLSSESFLKEVLKEQSSKGDKCATSLLEKINNIPNVFPFGEERVFWKDDFANCAQFFYCGYDNQTDEDMQRKILIDDFLNSDILSDSLFDTDDIAMPTTERKYYYNDDEESVMNTLLYGDDDSLGL